MIDWCLMAACLMAAVLGQLFVNHHWPRRIPLKRITHELRREFRIERAEFWNIQQAALDAGSILEFEFVSLPVRFKEQRACEHRQVRLVYLPTSEEWIQAEIGREYSETRYRILCPKQVM